MKFLIRVVITAVALWIATLVVSGIDVTAASTPRKIGTLVVVAAVFGMVNGSQPIIKKLGCAFYVLTLGLMSFVVNALLLWFTSWVADQMKLPFHVSGFWPAFWGAIVIGLVSWLLSIVLPDGDDKKKDKRRQQERY